MDSDKIIKEIDDDLTQHKYLGIAITRENARKLVDGYKEQEAYIKRLEVKVKSLEFDIRTIKKSWLGQ